jgi:hypothetical protein
MIKIHPHALQRSKERGVSKNEIINTVNTGESFPAKYGRIGFRKNYVLNDVWEDNYYSNKQIEVYTVKDGNDYLVITVIVKYF